MRIWTQNKDIIGGSTNTYFIALIPNDTRLTSFSIYIPISLCNVAYKDLNKIIANQLKNILPRIISSNQGGFL